MYDQFYGFSERPFSLLPDPDFLYLGEKHRAALDTLELAILNHSGFCVISGAIGAGKTTLIRELLNRLDDNVQVGLVSNTHPSFGELMQWVIAAYGLPGGTDDRLELHKRFIDYVIQCYSEGKHTLLIIDEAQNLSLAALEELRMLSNVNSEKDLVLQIIMIGQSELREKLRQPELVQFAQRISIDYYLGGLTPDETALYIQHRVTHAGGAADLFTADACRRVYEFSQGIPRVINRFCDLSLVYGYAQHCEQIGASLVEAVAQEQRLGETMEVARRRTAVPTSAVTPVVAAMTRAAENSSAADVLIGKIDTILASGAEQTDKIAVEALAVAEKEEVPMPAKEPDSQPAPESEDNDIYPELQVKAAHGSGISAESAPRPKEDAPADLHTLVVNAEQSTGTRGERGALWLFVGVAAMVAVTAWMSRDAWLPALQDVAVLNEQRPSDSNVPVNNAVPVDVEAELAGKAKREEAARLAKQQAAEKEKLEQAKREEAQREEAARVAKQRAAEKAKLEQAKREKARQEEAARLAEQQAAEKAKQEQAKRDKAQREEAARIARQRAAEKAKQEQAKREEAQREEAARVAKQQAAEKAVLEQAKRDEALIKAPAVESAAVTLASDQESGDSVSEPDGFSTNPCNGPTARFLSTCR